MKRVLISLLFLVGVAYGQGSVKGDAVIGSNGIPVPFPVVRICTATATTGGNPNTPCAPLDQIFTDATLSTTAPNPFTGDQGGNFQFFAAPGYHQVQICAAGLSCTMYPTLLAPDANNFGTMFGGAVVSNCSNQQSTCTPALTGVVRLSPNDTICWRNQANTQDVCLSLNSIGQIAGGSGGGSSVAIALVSITSNPAATGTIRLAQGDRACWRNAAGVADDCMFFNGNDYLSVAGSGVLSPQFVSSNNNPAQTGVVKLSSGDQVCWRNNANTGDICIFKNISDQIIGISAGATTQLISTNTPVASTGIVEMGASDVICWRNQGNTADVCISKNVLDQIVLGNGIQADTVRVSGNILLPSATNGGQLWLSGGSGSTVGRLFVGDGTGNFFRFSKRTGAATTDLISVSDSGVIQAQGYTSNAPTVAATGQIKLGAGDSICWRNNPNTADVCFSLTAGNAIQATNFSLGGTTTLSTLTFATDNTPLTQAPRLAWTASGLTNGSNNCPDAGVGTDAEVLPPGPNGITVRQFDISAPTAASGQTTAATWAVADLDASTTACSNTLGNGVFFNTTSCTFNIPAGHHLGMQLSTARTGGSSGAGCVYTIWYTMN